MNSIIICFFILFLFYLEKQHSQLLSVFELMLLENVIVIHIIEGQSNHAIKEVSVWWPGVGCTKGG